MGEYLTTGKRIRKLIECIKDELGSTEYNKENKSDIAVLESLIKECTDRLNGEKQVEESISRKYEKLQQMYKDKCEEYNKLKKKTDMDIAESKISNLVLNESTQKYRSLVDSSVEAIVSIDKKGNIIFWNNGAYLSFGYHDNEVRGRNIKELIPAFNTESLFEQWDAEDNENQSIRYMALKKDRSEFPVVVTWSLWSSRGRIFSTLIIRDVTENEMLLRELVNEKEELRATLHSVSEGIVSADNSGKIINMNIRAAEITGYSEPEAADRDIDSVLELKEGSISTNLSEIKGNPAEKIPTKRGVLKRKNGERISIEYSIAFTKTGASSNPSFVIAFQDITRRLQMEEELMTTQKMESIAFLAGGIAHDFNNIITGVTTNLFMVKMMLNSESEQFSLLEDAEEAAFKAADLTKQLLTLSKGGAIVKENASMQELITKSAKFCLSGASVDYSIDAPDNLPQLHVDKTQISQVFDNLIINAMQSMEEGGHIDVKAEVITKDSQGKLDKEIKKKIDDKDYLRISISDNGCGISEEVIDKIFEPYYTSKRDGTGLGMAISLSIIKRHSGYITVDSELEKGTCFKIYLPIEEAKVETTESSQNLEERALILSHDSLLSKCISDSLGRIGISSSVIDRKEQLISGIAGYEDGADGETLLFIDSEFFKAIRSEAYYEDVINRFRKNLKVKTVLIRDGSEEDSNGVDDGADYSLQISKPFNIKEFINKIMNLLDREEGGKIGHKAVSERR